MSLIQWEQINQNDATYPVGLYRSSRVTLILTTFAVFEPSPRGKPQSLVSFWLKKDVMNGASDLLAE